MSLHRRKIIKHQLKRFGNFMKTILNDKRALIGVIILIFYSTIALAAHLLTKNDPAYGYFVAGDYAAPSWLKYFPGGESLSENFFLVPEHSFPSPNWPIEWSFQTTQTSKASIEALYDASFGTSSGSPGSAQISFKRLNPAELSGTVKASLTKQFFYSATSPPKRMIATIAIWIKGAENLTSIDFRIYLIQAEAKTTTLWYQSFDKSNSAGWYYPEYPIDSYHINFRKNVVGNITLDPVKILFPQPANYTFGVEIIFRDLKTSTLNQKVEATVYIDDLNLQLYGNAYGLLGTDHLGRDIFSQLVYGARISLFVGLLSAALGVVIGLLVGLVSGFFGGFIDEILMRFTDALLIIPTLPLLLVLIAVIGPSIWNLIMVIGFLGWMGFARTIRSQVLSLKERQFIEAAKAAGAGKLYIIARHLVPNVISLVYVSLALSVPSAILSEAALSWLGLFDPTVVSWGRMLHDVQYEQGIDKWWWVIPPGLSIALVSLSFILIGFALDEILNPKLRQRR
jgi:ABC-type dipeptide/oligopeptide/nickel transport system permease subunit